MSAPHARYKRRMRPMFIDIALGSTAVLVALRFACTAEWSVVGLSAMIIVAVVAGRRHSVRSAPADVVVAPDKALLPARTSV